MGLNFWGLLGLITVPIIILLYLLKQKNREHTISSLYLWKQAILEVQANSPWQRLKRNILMMLQILAVILLSLALTRPYIKAFNENASHTIIVIDSSLSMQMKDNKETRLERAKREAIGLVDSLSNNQEITLINVYSEVIIEAKAALDKTLIKDAINSIMETNSVADMEAASQIVQGILKEKPDAVVTLFSDSRKDFNIGSFDFFNYNTQSTNYSIDLLSYSTARNGAVSALSVLSNHSDTDKTLDVSLYVDGAVFDAKEIDIEANKSINILWDNIPSNAQSLMCQIDSYDDLDKDNTMWAVVKKSEVQRVLLVTEHNVFLEKLLNIMDEVELYKTLPQATQDFKDFDLYIFDGYLPDKLPQDGGIIIFNPPYGGEVEIISEAQRPAFLYKNHSLLRYMEAQGFSIGETKVLKLPAWADNVLEYDGKSIAYSGVKDRQHITVFGFDLHDTDLPLTTAFPVLISNTISDMSTKSIFAINNIFSGERVEFVLNPETQKAELELPDGSVLRLAPPFPVSSFEEADMEGIYTLIQTIGQDTYESQFAVNVPSVAEFNSVKNISDVNKGNIDSEKNGIITDTPSEIQTDTQEDNKRDNTLLRNKGLERVILILLVLILIFEWWVYTDGI